MITYGSLNNSQVGEVIGEIKLRDDKASTEDEINLQKAKLEQLVNGYVSLVTIIDLIILIFMDKSVLKYFFIITLSGLLSSCNIQKKAIINHDQVTSNTNSVSADPDHKVEETSKKIIPPTIRYSYNERLLFVCTNIASDYGLNDLPDHCEGLEEEICEEDSSINGCEDYTAKNEDES